MRPAVVQGNAHAVPDFTYDHLLFHPFVAADDEPRAREVLGEWMREVFGDAGQPEVGQVLDLVVTASEPPHPTNGSETVWAAKVVIQLRPRESA